VNPDCKLTIAKTVGADVVHVEELVDTTPLIERATAILKAADDWTHDPDQLAAVRDGLASLMQAELDELKDGENELQDLYALLSALSAFLGWWANEAAEGEDPNPFNDPDDQMGAILMAATADSTLAPEAAALTKALGVFLGKNVETLEPAAAAPVVPTPPVEPAAEAIVPAVEPPVVEPPAAVTEPAVVEPPAAPEVEVPADPAEAAATEETPEFKAVMAALGAFTERLAKVEKMAAPGAPARMGDPNAQARITKAAELTAKRDEYMRRADSIGEADAAKGYRALAADVAQELDVINKSA
jgi:outer membrane biosynthesis protein TonB